MQQRHSYLKVFMEADPLLSPNLTLQLLLFNLLNYKTIVLHRKVWSTRKAIRLHLSLELKNVNHTLRLKRLKSSVTGRFFTPNK